MKEEDLKILKSVIEDYKIRDKIRDSSIIDEIRGEVKGDEKREEILQLIQNFSTKKDLAEKFLEIIPLYYDRSGVWWRWKSSINKWEITDEVDILNLIDGCAWINIISQKERTEILNALKQASRLKKPLEPKKTWIQFNKEIVDIETGERLEAKSKYFITNPIPWDLGKCEDTPNIDRIFEEWVGKNHVQTLYEIIAYCLLCDYPINRLFCLIGPGMNGKSKYLELLRKFVGDYNVCSTELDTLLLSRFEITRLHKKLVCQMGETNFNEMSRTAILKQLTGKDLIGFEYKNKGLFEDVNYAKILISTNNLPVTTDKTIGFYRRWLIIDFPNQFTEKKDILSEIPEVEYNNLCLKCIAVLFDLLKRREFTNEGTIEDRIKKFEDKSNPFKKFFDEYVIEDFDSFISKNDFLKRLNEWCKENRFRNLADNTVGKLMKEIGIEEGRKYADWLNDGKGGQMKIWLGIKWKSV